jgi:hypothetical protein
MHSLVESKTADNDREEDDEDLNESDTQSKRHETVSVLPGTFPIRTSKGESGEQAACSTAAKVLENFGGQGT